MSETAVEAENTADEASLTSRKTDTSLVDPLQLEVGMTSSSGGGGTASRDDAGPEGDSHAALERWHMTLARKAGETLERSSAGGTAHEVLEKKRTLAERLAAAYSEQLEEGVNMTIDVKPPQRGSGDEELAYHVRVAPNDSDYHSFVKTELPAWVISAIRYNRQRHTGTLGLLKEMKEVSGNKALYMPALFELRRAEKGIGAGFVYLAADVQRKMNLIPKSMAPQPLMVDGKLGQASIDRFTVYKKWQNRGLGARFQEYVAELRDVGKKRAGVDQSLSGLPPDIAAAVIYNRSKHTFTPGLLRALYKISGDQRLFRDALKSGQIGSDFVYLVRSAQIEMNRKARSHNEERVQVDGKLGPETIKRYDGGDGDEGYKKQKRKEDALKDAKENLGDLNGIDDFTKVTGGLLDSLLPREGDKRKMVIAANALIPAINGKLGLVFTVEGERSDNLKVRGEMKVQCLTSVKNMVFEAFAQLGVFGYLEVQANTGVDVMKMIIASMKQAVGKISKRAAELAFGKTSIDSVREQMDNDDYIEYGWGAEVSAGIKLKDIDNNKKGKEAGVEGKGRYQNGTRMTHKGDQKTRQLELSGKGAVSDWGEAEFKILPKWIDGDFNEIEMGTTLKRDVNLIDFKDQFAPGALSAHMITWVGKSIGLIQSVFKKQSNLNVYTGGRTIGEIVQAASGLPLNVPEHLTVAAARKIGALARKNPSFKMGQTLEIKLTVDSKGKAKLSFELANTTQFEIGESERDTFYLSIEQARRILFGEVVF
ncbi:MAG: hypothetical protein AAFV53_29985 [Myxococcota bacterium]